MKKTIIYWILAILITLTAAVYQRTTGPTYEKKVSYSYNNIEHEAEFLRSHSSNNPCPIVIPNADDSLIGKFSYRRYPSSEEYTEIKMDRINGELYGVLPAQPPAGKLEYSVSVQEVRTGKEVLNSGPIVVRFKGDVPASILTPHIFFMFFSMLLSNLTGLLALGKRERYKFWGIVTLVFLGVGGMILGPIVQKFAFGELWTGIPFGWDLTDNKTLVAFVAWIIAVVGNWREDRPILSLLAAIVMLIIFSIPHSAFGSELDYSTGTIGQG